MIPGSSFLPNLFCLRDLPGPWILGVLRDYHLPSLLLGIFLALCIGPILDFLLLARLELLWSFGRISRPIARLCRILLQDP